MPDEQDDLDRAEAALQEIEALFEAERDAEAIALLATLHPADQAEAVSDLNSERRALVLAALEPAAVAEIISFLREEPRRAFVEDLDPAVLGPLLDLVEGDVAADVLHALPEDRAQETLAAMSKAPDVAPLLQHEDETAGGRMTGDFIALNQDWSVGQALDHLRRTKPEAEQAFYLYVVDDGQRLEGVVSLRHLVVAQPEVGIAEIMTPEVVSVRTDVDQEEVARDIQRYNFIALPVIDEEGRLVGVATVDDLMDVVAEEATEDMYRMAGLTEGESFLRPVYRSIAPRLAWLFVALLSALAAAAVVFSFEGTIEKVAVLAAFMPVIAGLGGNTGIQTITLMVRSIALGEAELRDIAKILRRELLIGAVNGIVLGVTFGTIAYFWEGNVALGVVAGVAMLLNMVTAVTVGVLVPITLRAVKLDPALASGVLVTTCTDVLGFLFFLGLAALMVDRLT